MKKKITVALIFGGRSAEHEISMLSAGAIYKNLNPEKYAIISIYVTKNGLWKTVDSPLSPAEDWTRGQAMSFLPWEKGVPDGISSPDIYFPVLHGPYGEDGTIQGLLEMADVPYVGSGVLASSIGMDKALCKSLFEKKGLPVVRWKILLSHQWEREREAIVSGLWKEFESPLFVKPSNLGSSVGVTKVTEPSKLSAALDLAFRYDRKILVEEGILGRELECSVLGNDEPKASLPGEVIPSREFYDYRDKYLDGKTGFIIPAELPPPLVLKIQELAVEAFKTIDGSGMARVDFFSEEKTGKIFLNEINTIPGFTEISMYPRLWGASGLPFPRLVDRLIEFGFERHRIKRRCVNWDLG